MAKLPEGRQPLLWKDMPFAERPKAHPSTERLEIDKLKERVAELETCVANAREETLREAAEVAAEEANWVPHKPDDFRKAILALIKKDPT